MWTNTSITLDLQDVSVRLQIPTYSDIQTSSELLSLACINFIKSSLKIDQFSDGSQDIDLVSQEILVTDSRFVGSKSPSSGPTNCFTNILQPINLTPNSNTVQAEVHSRRRKDCSKYTILLNNMRMMAILDWLESVQDFMSTNADSPIISYPLNRIDTITYGSESGNVSSSGAIEEPSVELVLNITDSELVFVEQTDQWNTNAVILKSTTVVSYRPAELNKVMSINLNHLEVFSCILGNEDATALSIIDPVTINLDLKQNTLDIQLQKRLCIRLSYHDLKMFTQMLQSIPKQTKNAKSKDTASNSSMQIVKLSSLGFKTPDCERALEICDHEVDEAALWLTQNAEPSRVISQQSLTVNPLDINSIFLRASSISICVIDDCLDADVPLLEVSLSHIEFSQETSEPRNNGNGSFKAGNLKGTFSSDYYSRDLSGWEPLLEPWKCCVSWSYSLGSGIQRNRLQLRVTSDDLLKLNITTTVINLFDLVHKNWMQDYYGAQNSSQLIKTYRPRVPFVPFAIKNDSGVTLWFTTLISETGIGKNSPSSLSRSTDGLSQSETRWTAVEPGETKSFSFGPPSKQRHLDSHKLNFHQVGVRVEGWAEVGPVSVDQVGIFFRHSRHESDEYRLMPRTRIVFAVTLEGSAQKLITVRSAVQIHNKLNHKMMIKMEHFFGHLNIRAWPKPLTAVVLPKETVSIPLTHVHSFLFFRPLPPDDTALSNAVSIAVASVCNNSQANDVISPSTVVQTFNGNDYWNQFEGANIRTSTGFANSYQFCSKSVHWKDMEDSEEVHQELRNCKGNCDRGFRWVAAVRRVGFPVKESTGIPGHSITLWPPLRLNNLLPCDLLYKLPSGTQGRVSSSETEHIHDVNLDEAVEITLTLDGYPKPAPILIPTGIIGSVETNLRLTDVKGRLLILRVNIVVIRGSGMQINVSASFWLINRTGIPLVFRQEGVAHESAGQFTENEQARLVSPLMYSISDPDASPAMTMRLGKRFGGSPPWCQPFSMHKDIIHRQLRSDITNETFIIGIEVRRGRGRYRKTSVLTFSPRFQLYNRSSYKLQFSQKCFASNNVSVPLKNKFRCDMYLCFAE